MIQLASVRAFFFRLRQWRLPDRASLGWKIYGSFTLLSLGVLLVGALALSMLAETRNRTVFLESVRAPELEIALALERQAYEIMLNFIAYSFSGDDAQYSGGRQNLALAKETVNRAMRLSRDRQGAEALHKAVASFDASIKSLDERIEGMRTLAQSAARRQAQLQQTGAAVQDAMAELVRELHGYMREVPFSGKQMNSFLAAWALYEEASRAWSQARQSTLIGFGGGVASPAFSLKAQPARGGPEPAGEAAQHVTAAEDAWQKLRGSHEFFQENKTLEGVFALFAAYTEQLRSLEQILSERQALAAHMAESASALVELTRGMAAEAAADISGTPGYQSVSGLRLMLYLGLASMLLAFGGMAFWLVRQVLLPLRQVTAFAVSAAEGEPLSTLALHRQDELGQLADALRQMIGALREARHKVLQQEHSSRTHIARMQEALTLLCARERQLRDQMNMAQAGQTVPPSGHGAREEAAALSAGQKRPEDAGRSPGTGPSVYAGKPSSTEQSAKAVQELSDLSETLQGLIRSMGGKHS